MAGAGSWLKPVSLGLAGLLVAASIGGMLWLWLGGGVSLPGQKPQTVEECGVRISGASALTARMAPALVAAFLERGGYAVSGAGPAAPEVTVVGVREGLQCSVTVARSVSLDGFKDLASGASLIALSQKPIAEPEITALLAAGAGDFAADRALAEHLIALDALAIVVNAANPVAELKVDDVAAISVGFVKNWQFYTQQDVPLTLYGPRDGTAPDDYPNDVVPMRTPIFEAMQQRATVFATEEEVAAAVAADPGAFGFFSAAFAAGASNARTLPIRSGGVAHGPTAENIRNQRYPMIRRMFAYVRPADMRSNAFAQRFMEFITSEEAAPVIAAAGFVPAPPKQRSEDTQSQLTCLQGTAEAASIASAIRGGYRVGEPLQFAPNTLDLTPDSRGRAGAAAAELAKQLQAGSVVTLIGHTDVSGDADANRGLGLRRALLVREMLEQSGVFGLAVESAGEMCPAYESESQEGRLLNQRVEIWVRPPTAAN